MMDRKQRGSFKGHEIWNNVKRVMEEFESLVFQDLAKMPEMYLKYFQTNSPMLPVVNDVFENLVHRLLQIFIKSKIAEGTVAANKLTKVD